MLPAASGWRAIDSNALLPILLIPIAAPITAILAANAAPNFAKGAISNAAFATSCNMTNNDITL